MTTTLAKPLRFIIPATLGAFVFLFPVITDDKQTVLFGVITDFFQAQMAYVLQEILLVIIAVSAIGGLATSLSSKKSGSESLRAQAFELSLGWLLLRIAGLFVVSCVYFDIGPEIIRLPDTGITVVHDIGLNIVVIYFVGLALMPLMTDYGLMELVGTFCKPFFQSLFRLPGRAAIDTLTSLVSASSIGLLVTISQYQQGGYNAREASVIATNFSIVSIPFALVIANITGIEQMFFSWYLTVILSCLITAMVMARIPPLASIPETQLAPAPVAVTDNSKAWERAYRSALEKAANAPGPRSYLNLFAKNFMTTAFGVLGPCIALATLATIILFHTPIVDWIVAPISSVLTIFSVAEASTIAPGLIAGFGDQFLPALIAAKLQDEFWRFILAGLSVSQLIFMSEFGVLVLRSPLPIGLTMLAKVFLLRTALTLPVLSAAAWWLTRS
ncbi:MAG: nucleoside recognition membrane protein YjiH [Candidatus Azotimanducaceae bacterium]|jgi:nucleoside recognition membrane protein YjiH